MSVQVVGISGSPIPDSNTDRAVKRILEFTGLTSRFVKLSDLDLAPCRACLGCVKTNQCVVQDDGQALAELFHDASAFVIGGYTPYSSLDARTKAFMERMYCHRHRVGGNARKFGVAVITTACPPGNSRNAPCRRNGDFADRLLDDGGRDDEPGDDGDPGERPVHSLRLRRRLLVQRHQDALRSRGYCGLGRHRGRSLTEMSHCYVPPRSWRRSSGRRLSASQLLNHDGVGDGQSTRVRCLCLRLLRLPHLPQLPFVHQGIWQRLEVQPMCVRVDEEGGVLRRQPSASASRWIGV